jgi:homospermidine synthase
MLILIPTVFSITLPPPSQMNPAKGDIVIELACRIDTHTIWKECKSRGVHFMNSGFDVWPDITLDLDLMQNIFKDAVYSKGKGPTCVFSFGCNPGIASHFVRHGLFMATGLEDTRAAAKAFGLTSISFNERDTQWPAPGSAGEKLFNSTQLDVLYNTWSPGNYIVETGESTILYAGCPEEAKSYSSAGPAVLAWTPSGPTIGFMAPHDETFTIQVSLFNPSSPKLLVMVVVVCVCVCVCAA